MAAISLPSLLLSPSYFNSDPIDEEEFEECNTLTVLDYGNTGKPNRWMTPQYLSLQIRCSGLMRDEAQRALKHHFRSESNEKLQHLPGGGKKTKWPHGNELFAGENKGSTPIVFFGPGSYVDHQMQQQMQSQSQSKSPAVNGLPNQPPYMPQFTACNLGQQVVGLTLHESENEPSWNLLAPRK